MMQFCMRRMKVSLADIKKVKQLPGNYYVLVCGGPHYLRKPKSIASTVMSANALYNHQEGMSCHFSLLPHWNCFRSGLSIFGGGLIPLHKEKVHGTSSP